MKFVGQEKEMQFVDFEVNLTCWMLVLVLVLAVVIVVV